MILSEGAQRQAIFLIKDGVVRVERGHMGFNVEVSRLHPGEIFGEMGMIDDRPRSATVTATDVEASNGVIHVVNGVVLPRM